MPRDEALVEAPGGAFAGAAPGIAPLRSKFMRTRAARPIRQRPPFLYGVRHAPCCTSHCSVRRTSARQRFDTRAPWSRSQRTR